MSDSRGHYALNDESNSLMKTMSMSSVRFLCSVDEEVLSSATLDVGISETLKRAGRVSMVYPICALAVRKKERRINMISWLIALITSVYFMNGNVIDIEDGNVIIVETDDGNV